MPLNAVVPAHIGRQTAAMTALVLTYHSVDVRGHDYGCNDHLALASDLRSLTRAGWRVLPLAALVDAWEREALVALGDCIAITLDDGCMLDARDAMHPTCGEQRGMLGILEDFREEFPDAQSGLHATSFVIASPDARAELDRRDYLSLNWWGDDWWREAQDSGLGAIESHSWDHNHPSLKRTAMEGPRRFDTLATRAEALAEIEQANQYIAKITGRAPRFFAYPWGQVSPYLANEYFPREVDAHGLRAAFTTEPAPLDGARDRWRLPRFVCGEHWRSEDAFADILVTHATPALRT